MKTRGGWRETPQAHEVAVRDVTAMSDEELIERIRVLDQQIAPMLELEAVKRQRIRVKHHHKASCRSARFSDSQATVEPG